MPYRRSRAWLMATTDEQAIHEATYTREFIHILKNLSKIIPENECVYSFQTPIVMLFTGRITGSLPKPEVSDSEFIQTTSACRFILATYLADSMGFYPRFYPLKRLENNSAYTITPFYLNGDDISNPVAFLLERIK